jgi:multicomponent Na+:H+ antiporter subunit A
MVALAGWTTARLQSGYLRYYLLIIILTTTGLASFTVISMGGAHWPPIPLFVRFYDVVLAALVLIGALVAVTVDSRLTAVAALGVTGYGVALIYLVFGAPDLAMTQFVIESLTVILFVLVFYHLPKFAQLTRRAGRLRDAGVSLLAGGLMTTLVLSAARIEWYPAISSYFGARAVPEAHGRNVVNVILVDFRGLDTLGEITVLAIAAVGVVALLKLRRDREAGE